MFDTVNKTVQQVTIEHRCDPAEWEDIERNDIQQGTPYDPGGPRIVGGIILQKCTKCGIKHVIRWEV